MTRQNTYKSLNLDFFEIAGKGQIARITLNRPDIANAFSLDVIQELAQVFSEMNHRDSVRVILLRSEGKHFSAGADLNWMKAAAKFSFEDNIKDASLLITMLESVINAKAVTIAQIHGSSFGGALGLIAACDIAIASESAKFCLSEVKLGLLPAVILPYLARKIPHVALRRLALTATLFDAADAVRYGLVSEKVSDDKLNAAVFDEIHALLQCGPEAQQAFKSLHETVIRKSFAQGQYTAEAIAKARTGKEGQSGLNAFFEKSKAPWCASREELPPI